MNRYIAPFLATVVATLIGIWLYNKYTAVKSAA